MEKSIINLIEEMQEVKTAHPTLEIQEILRLFNIDATRNLVTAIRRFINGR